MVIISIILFIVGLLLLIKGADWLVDGASSFAKKMNISGLVIGLTIVAFGTSAPELVVSTISAINGNADIAIGNIIGSNIANVLLILGVCSIIYPLTVDKGTVWKQIPFSLLAVVLLYVLANDQLIDNQIFSSITRIDGLVLLAFFIIFLYYIFSIAKNVGGVPEEYQVKELGMFRSILFVILGLGCLALGGKWVVDSAVQFATMMGVSQSLIGLTIVAVGTSLPELAASAVAAYKKKSDIAIGNVVGSNIFNVFWILGSTSLIRPLPFNLQNNSDVLVAIITSVILFLMMFIGKKYVLQRSNGVIFLGFYVAYVVFLVARG